MRTEDVYDMDDDYDTRAEKLVSLIRKQNWKLGGALIMDRDMAVQLIRDALDDANSDGANEVLDDDRW